MPSIIPSRYDPLPPPPIPRTSGYVLKEFGYSGTRAWDGYSLDDIILSACAEINGCDDGARRLNELKEAIDELIQAKAKRLLKV